MTERVWWVALSRLCAEDYQKKDRAYCNRFLRWARIRTCTADRSDCVIRWKSQSCTCYNRRRTLHHTRTHQPQSPHWPPLIFFPFIMTMQATYGTGATVPTYLTWQRFLWFQWRRPAADRTFVVCTNHHYHHHANALLSWITVPFNLNVCRKCFTTDDVHTVKFL